MSSACRRRSARALLALWLGWAAPGCGAATRDTARSTAEQTSGCGAGSLTLQSLGTLVVRPSAPLGLDVFEAEGCATRFHVFCQRQAPGRCARRPGALLALPDARAAELALHLRRSVDRARCAPGVLQVVQQSESLWSYQACDVEIALHCRGRRCEALSTRRRR